MLGGDYGVLSTEIYLRRGRRAARLRPRRVAGACCCWSSRCGAFFLQRRIVGTRSYATISGKGDSGLPTPLPDRARRGGAMDRRCRGRPSRCLLYGFAFVGGFVKVWGRDYTPTLDHYAKAFAIERTADGLIWTGAAWNSFWTTVKLAAIAAPLTAALGLLAAWLLVRQRFAGRATLEFATHARPSPCPAR